MSHQKREASSSNEDWASKRPKGAATSTENDCQVETASSQETNGEKRDTSQKGSNLPLDPCISDEKSATISEVPSQQEMILTSVEADAAEDKGCRHTMEDAWVVLPDASMGSPGNLRSAHFAIYDGHGGRLAAEYAQKHLHPHVIAAGLPRELMNVKVAKKAIIEGFRKADESLLQESAKGKKLWSQLSSFVPLQFPVFVTPVCPGTLFLTGWLD
ncbi:unnamed protein product [Triticum turgidum subsp. durum]|uniref:protein-serine/threonine phosphatase n=1 Tax=Triticum turgidum subsp. durum TaxID=4567 RepID=A0A9R0TNX1_TRITD|nr:unnamed protein product [Triticum turgidum subsp. durum]